MVGYESLCSLRPALSIIPGLPSADCRYQGLRLRWKSDPIKVPRLRIQSDIGYRQTGAPQAAHGIPFNETNLGGGAGLRISAMVVGIGSIIAPWLSITPRRYSMNRLVSWSLY